MAPVVERVLNARVRTLFSTLDSVTTENPVLLEGEVWTEKDASSGNSTGRKKVGNGTTPFNSLPFEPVGGEIAVIDGGNF